MPFHFPVQPVVVLGCALLACASRLGAADAQRLLLVSNAQNDFERLALDAGSVVTDAARCQQSEAALLPVASPQEVAVIHFRKGYCTLASATVTRRAEDFVEAAREFEKTIEVWPERAGRPKKSLPDPIPSLVPLLLSIARLEPGLDAIGLNRVRMDLSSAIDRFAFSNSLLPAGECRSLLATGRLWLGWIDLRRDDLFSAKLDFSGTPDSPWSYWTAGRQAFRDRQYPEAATQYRQAVDGWDHTQIEPAGSLAARLSPPPDRGHALEELGGAQLLSGDFAGAIATLDTAVKASPSPARALYLRAQAEERAGRIEPALADYSLASRAALADANGLASGEAHLYRGILLYRRHDPRQAESEFASALHFDIPDALRPDAVAWRRLAAVAAGACTSSRILLEQSLATASPYFPKSEARALAAACPLTGSGI